MRREVPLFLCFVFGSFFVVSNFIRDETILPWTEQATTWMSIIIAFTYVLGVGNVVRIHSKKIARRETGWGYSVATVSGVAVMILYGLVFWIFTNGFYGPQPQAAPGVPAWMTGSQPGSVSNWFYDAVYTPMQATMFALLAFFISSAAFRAFRARSFQAGLLAVTALVLIVGGVPLGELVWGGFSELTSWIMECLQMAGKRAILIGAALGAVATGVKVILGLEKSYLGGR